MLCMQVWNPKASQPVPSVVLPFLACIGQVVLFMGFYLKFVSEGKALAAH